MPPIPRRRPGPAAGCLLTGVLLAVVGATPAGRQAARESDDTAAIVHVLNRVGFGPREGDVERVRRIGIAAYVEAQLQPERIDDSALEARLVDLRTLEMSTRDLSAGYFVPARPLGPEQRRDQEGRNAGGTDGSPARIEGEPSRRVPPGPARTTGPQLVMSEVAQARVLRAVYSERQLQEVLVDFWFNHFNVFSGKGAVRQYLTEYEREVIRPHVLGRFRELLGRVAESPAMLFYLDNWQSASPVPVLPPRLADRLADPRLSPGQQEQLLARRDRQRAARNGRLRGLNENYARELMELHTLGVDGGYTQQDVTELARIFTGWTIDRPREGGGFVFRPAMHDPGTKTLLGRSFVPAGQNEGRHALDLLASHPSTARHIAYKLAQRFVADEPPAALVNRAARTFLDTDGDIREVVRVILTSPEFFSADARRAKIKTPFEFVVSAVRATGAAVVDARPLVAALRTLGMPLYGCQPPTGYANTADTWVNTGALLQRMNFAVELTEGGRARRAPVRIDIASLASGTGEAARDRLVTRLLAGEASASTRETLAGAATPRNLVALVLGSPEFQRR